jgi:ISXO2-like transposase domain
MNAIEGYYSIFKRGMKGVYQHCGERHIQRYLAEFDFRLLKPRRARRQRRKASS